MIARDPDQCRQAITLANVAKTRRAEIRSDLRTGHLTLVALLESPPSEIADMLLWEVLLLVPQVGRGRVNTINARAVLAGYNLAISLGRADPATRVWLSENLKPCYSDTERSRRRRARLAADRVPVSVPRRLALTAAAAACVDLADMLERYGHDQDAEDEPIEELILAVPMITVGQCVTLLAKAGINDARTPIRHLSMAERKKLAFLLRFIARQGGKT